MRSPVTLALTTVGLSIVLSACGTSESAPEATADASKPLSATEKAQVAQATTEYTTFVQDELDGLVAQTAEFVAAVKAGDDDRARYIYPNARARWERVETIAA